MGVIPGPALEPEFLHFYFLSLDMRKIGSGSAIPQINNYDINPLELFYPPSRDVQKTVVEALQTLKDQSIALATSYQARIRDLADLRQSLLRKAFSGELT